jgi:WD40 repeat protein
MVIHNYESVEKLSGHTGSITALRFSPNGRYLASACENGVVLVTATESWEVVKKLVNVSSVTAVAWDPTFPMTVICGFSSGVVVTVYIGDTDVVRRFLIMVVHEP